MNRRADALVIQAGGSFTLNEGAEFNLARDTVKALCDAAEDARNLATIVVETLSSSTIGFDASRKTQCLSALKASGIDAGRKKSVATILDALNEIYSKPSVATACRALGKIMRNPPDWLKRAKFPRNLDAIAAIGDSSEDPRDTLESIVAHDRQLARTAPRTISTIHKAKGLEYEAVLLWNFSSKDFPMDRKSAKLLYVAISRPTNQLILVAPGQSLSPFAPPNAVG
jgi:DNA helicase-2/ATP-dependent DNA helicase PcrA